MEIEVKDPQTLVFIPLTLAAWLRYLIGIDDQGKPFIPSPDPLLTDLQHKLTPTILHDLESLAECLEYCIKEQVREKHKYKLVFKHGIALSELTFIKMVAGPNAVRKTLQDYLQEHGGNLSWK
ncbi:hypothetical protein EfmAA610_15370 [Enterococcus faecium]|nr:hypothetical protein EfmAA610_15370 [Enterococcus faecium]